MNEQASILFNISSSFSGNKVGKVELSLPSSYFQRSIYAALARSLYTQEGFELLGRQLAAIARHAYFARQMDTVEQASQLMLALPLSKELKSVAQYYQAICAWKQGNADAAHQIFSYAIDKVSRQYQAQGLLTVGAIYFGQAEYETALPYYLAAARAAREGDLLIFVASQKMTAVVQSIYGDHQQALNNLERLFPAVRTIAKDYPGVYYEFLNSYAVELGEVGRIAEAQKVCETVLASPFVTANPQFAQTRDELAAKRTAATPSVIAVPAVPEIASSAQAQVEPEPEPARARSTISLKFRRSYSLTRVLTTAPHSAVILSVSTLTILDRLAYSTLPRSPPALS
jgi:tetratricopeptide (TPR) repeat protein